MYQHIRSQRTKFPKKFSTQDHYFLEHVIAVLIFPIHKTNLPSTYIATDFEAERKNHYPNEHETEPTPRNC